MVDGVESGRKIKEAKTRQLLWFCDRLRAQYLVNSCLATVANFQIIFCEAVRTVGYPSDSLASCFRLHIVRKEAVKYKTCNVTAWNDMKKQLVLLEESISFVVFYLSTSFCPFLPVFWCS